MRTWLVVLVAAIALALGSVLADAAGYTLYYLDGTHNVRHIALDAAGSVVGKSSAVTTKGGYDFFSISPDGTRLLGFKMLSREYDKDTRSYWMTWRVFAEQVGKRAFRRSVKDISNLADSPTVMWSPGGGYAQLAVGAFDLDLEIYSFPSVRNVLRTCDYLAFSPDERYALGYVWNSSQLGIMDMRSGNKVSVSSEGFDPSWVGLRRIEWAGASDGVYAAEVASRGDEPIVQKRTALKRRTVAYGVRPKPR